VNSKLRHELKSFGLVAAGAIPGALLQLYLAIHSGSIFKAMAVILASMAGGLALVCLGYAMGRLWQGRRV
jgi:hypothetical protein